MLLSGLKTASKQRTDFSRGAFPGCLKVEFFGWRGKRRRTCEMRLAFSHKGPLEVFREAVKSREPFWGRNLRMQGGSKWALNWVRPAIVGFESNSNACFMASLIVEPHFIRLPPLTHLIFGRRLKSRFFPKFILPKCS